MRRSDPRFQAIVDAVGHRSGPDLGAEFPDHADVLATAERWAEWASPGEVRAWLAAGICESDARLLNAQGAEPEWLDVEVDDAGLEMGGVAA